MNRRYVLLFDNASTSLNEMNEVLDAVPEILDWQQALPNSYLLLSDHRATDLADRIAHHLGKRNRQLEVLILEANENRAGYLGDAAWSFLDHSPHYYTRTPDELNALLAGTGKSRKANPVHLPRTTQQELDEAKRKVGWDVTTGQARVWWEAFEKENQQRLPLVLRVVEELARRQATISEFFLAYVYSNTDNIQANLCYLEYRMLKTKEEREKRNEAANADRPTSAEHATTRQQHSQSSGTR